MEKEDLVIDVHNLSKCFDGRIAVEDLSIQISKGQIFGFLGANGSGKTTTIRMLCGLLTPDSGSGTCLGYDIVKESSEIKKNSGYMTQSFSLYSDLSVYENLDFIARIYQLKNRKEKVQRSLDRLNINAQMQKQLTGTLSGGWKQRLALAGAIIHDPKLLLLDEPTAGVDPKARRDFWDRIHQLSTEGITTLVSTHYMDEAERCDILGYLSRGKWLAVGTADEIIEHSHLICWNGRGPNLFQIAQELKENENVQQTSIFGQTIHVTGTDERKLEEAIKPFRTHEYIWERVPPNLEDAFINYMLHTKERFIA